MRAQPSHHPLSRSCRIHPISMATGGTQAFYVMDLLFTMPCCPLIAILRACTGPVTPTDVSYALSESLLYTAPWQTDANQSIFFDFSTSLHGRRAQARPATATWASCNWWQRLQTARTARWAPPAMASGPFGLHPTRTPTEPSLRTASRGSAADRSEASRKSRVRSGHGVSQWRAKGL